MGEWVGLRGVFENQSGAGGDIERVSISCSVLKGLVF